MKLKSTHAFVFASVIAGQLALTSLAATAAPDQNAEKGKDKDKKEAKAKPKDEEKAKDKDKGKDKDKDKGKPGDAGKEKAPSAAVAAIVAERKIGDFDLKVHDLKAENGTKLPTTSNAQYEVYKVPTQQQAADMFVYHVVFDAKANQYWIVRSGGFAGQTVTYGPATPKAPASPAPAAPAAPAPATPAAPVPVPVAPGPVQAPATEK